ncbi:gamma-glutamyl-gamma-aminobutyrate hydrolase [Subtercola boreus]|uniref:Gamma-glutamyl-gamma-aminobutyrate hydrolase n=1 Tax=Subtercola boreus TaxID=120213 RepID=A0A3E0VGB3_9MICO|nr:gamma-glutamyl-gamma-aminobutyrate hydrolase family protein [Subtercola boreus]RFA08478.1 gamma-glutamyl-gamma-aminobutyrate hydrolase [Subtercola boreus]TQL54599.1 putative glutamine amidotransferase [Subtercola boreus]
MPLPVIGLTTYLEQAKSGIWDVPAAFLPHVYFDAVNRAGGIAVLLPPQPVDTAVAGRVLDGLDGLIVTGGMDVAPGRYGQEPHSETDAPRPDRDAWETALLTSALERGIPFLGICRGAQLLNVALGGTLHQHLPDIVGDARYQPGDARFGSVVVDIDPTSKLAGLMAAAGHPVTPETLATPETTASPANPAAPLTLDVPVYHHQAVDRLGEGLRVVAATGDRIVEALEVDGTAFALGVQWHPEQTPEDLSLFAGLVDAARDYAANR